jgi:hypothetical protein
VLPENHAMLELARRLGFTVTLDTSAGVMRISRDLDSDVEEFGRR